MTALVIHTPNPTTFNTGQYEQTLLHGGVKKRISVLQYLRKALPPSQAIAKDSQEGDEHWFDTIICTKEDLERIYAEQKGLAKKYTFSRR
jgi:hypothetical protein